MQEAKGIAAALVGIKEIASCGCHGGGTLLENRRRLSTPCRASERIARSDGKSRVSLPRRRRSSPRLPGMHNLSRCCRRHVLDWVVQAEVEPPWEADRLEAVTKGHLDAAGHGAHAVSDPVVVASFFCSVERRNANVPRAGDERLMEQVRAVQGAVEEDLVPRLVVARRPLSVSRALVLDRRTE